MTIEPAARCLRSNRCLACLGSLSGPELEIWRLAQSICERDISIIPVSVWLFARPLEPGKNHGGRSNHIFHGGGSSTNRTELDTEPLRPRAIRTSKCVSHNMGFPRSGRSVGFRDWSNVGALTAQAIALAAQPIAHTAQATALAARAITHPCCSMLALQL